MTTQKYENIAKAGVWLIYGAAFALIGAYILIAISNLALVYVTWPYAIIPLVVIMIGVRYIDDSLILGIIALIPSIVALVVFFLIIPFQSILQLLGGILGVLGSVLAIVGSILGGR